METRANYALIGVFTLAVIASAFGFVFWYEGGDTAGGQRSYKIVFTGSVTGLLRGAPVLFNGLRVGDVTNIEISPQDPGHVSALIELDARIPVRADTKAHLESTGLTGVASIALSGGAEQSPPLPPGPGGGPGVIIADDRAGFQELLQSAQRISGQASDFLAKTNRIMDDSAAAVTASVKNVEKFSDALAANSDGIKDFLSSMADVGRAIKPLSAKLETLTTDIDAVVKAVNPNQVKTIVADVAAMSAKLNAAADKVDGVLTNLNGFLATGDNKGAFGEIAEAAKSIRKVADDFNVRMKEIAANVNRFTGPGLRQYEALAVDGRKTLEEINQAVRSIETNPQQFIFGKKQQTLGPAQTGSR